MAHSTWHVYGSVFLRLFMCFVCEDVITDSDQVHWYDTKPIVSMEYKVHINAGKEECYYVYAQPEASIYINTQVIRGGDGMAGFAVRHPSGDMIHPHEYQTSSEYRDERSTGGYYGVCIDNQLSRYAEKLVNIYINVVKHEDWKNYIEEIQSLHLNIKNFTEVVGVVERNIQDMLFFQSHTRNRESRDMALLFDNNSYIENWSILQIAVIILTCSFQVYFVRKLFDSKTGSTKNRI